MHGTGTDHVREQHHSDKRLQPLAARYEMSQRLYLDVASAFKAGYNAAFDGLNWPIAQATYDSVAKAFVEFLEEIATGPTLSESERYDLALSIVPIANESFYYASSHMQAQWVGVRFLAQCYVLSGDSRIPGRMNSIGPRCRTSAKVGQFSGLK